MTKNIINSEYHILLDALKKHLRAVRYMDLQSDFPEIKGFSTRNLKYMRKFAQEYPDSEFVQEVLAQIPWGRNVFLMDSVSEKQTILFYVKQTINI